MSKMDQMFTKTPLETQKSTALNDESGSIDPLPIVCYIIIGISTVVAVIFSIITYREWRKYRAEMRRTAQRSVQRPVQNRAIPNFYINL